MSKAIWFYFCFSLLSLTLMAGDIQNVELAGSWYPDSPGLLRQTIQNYLDQAEIPLLQGRVLALVSPHAGIAYSGGVAAWGFKAASLKPVGLVVVVGFSHRQDYDGTAVFDKEGFQTPLGVLYTDKELLEKITGQDKIFADSRPFKAENSIELQLPFIQVALGDPQVLLLAIGRQNLQNARILGEALYEILKDKDDFLLIASTDLSHYLSQAEARTIDASTARAIIKLEPEELFSICSGQNRACGLAAVTAVEICVKKLGADQAVILKQATSADNGAAKTNVVGYLSAAFTKPDRKIIQTKESVKMESLFNLKQRKELLGLARKTIDGYLKQGKILQVETEDPALKEVRGVFVTLRKDEQLRGCIGNIIASQPLYLSVRDMAIAAATQDPRFPRLRTEELPNIKIEISVLSRFKKITDPDEIVIGTHGVLVKKGSRSGLYLPQVAIETGWNREEFMDSLCAEKAGIAKDSWSRGDCEIQIFTAEAFSE
ncbi:MAG: AmmeMemoRadiSam system protein B [Candidatus Omnitrophica bacterium]|nr:AmmeMemoRadiSam system protein B [Candidatus Omnitrophota bacterium]